MDVLPDSADIPPPPPAEDERPFLDALLQDGSVFAHELGNICEESAELLREECYLALESATVGVRWLVVTAIAVATSWFCINIAAVAAVISLGLPWGMAALAVSAGNAVLAWYAHTLAGQRLDDMRFRRIRGLLGRRT